MVAVVLGGCADVGGVCLQGEVEPGLTIAVHDAMGPDERPRAGMYTFTVTTGLAGPESCLWDPVSKYWYVSNQAANAANDGFISRIPAAGLMSSPPLSKLIPLPTSATRG